MLRLRPLVLGILAVGLAARGQQLLVEQHESALAPAVRWYLAGIVVLMLAWCGTAKNQTLVRLIKTPSIPDSPAPSVTRDTTAPAQRSNAADRTEARCPPSRVLPYVLAGSALVLNFVSVNQIRQDYYSILGALGWLISLVLLATACARLRGPAGIRASNGEQDVEGRTDLRLSPLLEGGVVLALLAAALGLRLYRLDDWTAGMHGDEGQFGLNALQILAGGRVSPFLPGSFGFANLTYWCIAGTMQIFGTGLGGLRMFSVLAGTLLILPFYLLVRLWFGIRLALIASVLLAVSDLAVYFSRLALNNIMTPLSLVTGFCLLAWGLHTGRTILWVLAGYAFLGSLYFYSAGQLNPILVSVVLVYLFLILPLVQLPGVYQELRTNDPNQTRIRVLGQALGKQARGVGRYAGQVLALVSAGLCIASPWVISALDHPQIVSERGNIVMIFNHPDLMADRYRQTHEPLYLALHWPQPGDLVPLPLAFAAAPLSVPLLRDGFWPRVIWDQTGTTLAMFTYRPDGSSFVPFANEPVIRPVEAVLLFLGLAWVAWRWRDARLGILALWFWTSVLAGGALTIDAPNITRVVGVVPLLALFVAMPLNKLVAEAIALVERFGRRPALARRVGAMCGGALLAVLAAVAAQNVADLYSRYLVMYPFTIATGQAVFVRQITTAAIAAGQPVPRFYNLGAGFQDWTYPVNAFLNRDILGADMRNVAQELPLNVPADRDVVFLIWDVNSQYLPLLKLYYPGGGEGSFQYGPNPQQNRLFTYYRVSAALQAAERGTNASYRPAQGQPTMEAAPGFGTEPSPPANLAYPVQAHWVGSLIAPAFAQYRFKLTAPAGAQLVVDGLPVVTTTSNSREQEGAVILARGPHEARLDSILADYRTAVQLRWAIDTTDFGPIPPAAVWRGPGRGLLAIVRSATGSTLDTLPNAAQNEASGVLQRRVDGFLGFRDIAQALGGNDKGLVAVWTGILTVPQTGPYGFDFFSNGGVVVFIDGERVLDNRRSEGNPLHREVKVPLTSGPHRLEVRYQWTGGAGYLEAFEIPPTGQKRLLGPDLLQTTGGGWLPGSITNPPAYKSAAP